jgi:hypothetical protein
MRSYGYYIVYLLRALLCLSYNFFSTVTAAALLCFVSHIFISVVSLDLIISKERRKVIKIEVVVIVRVLMYTRAVSIYSLFFLCPVCPLLLFNVI